MESKMSTPIDVLCKGFGLEFTTFVKYCKSLRFDEEPNYDYLRRILKELFIKNNYEYDYNFDWLNPSYVTKTNYSNKPSEFKQKEPIPKQKRIALYLQTNPRHKTIPPIPQQRHPLFLSKRRPKIHRYLSKNPKKKHNRFQHSKS